jgi:hypothetical protein
MKRRKKKKMPTGSDRSRENSIFFEKIATNQ